MREKVLGYVDNLFKDVYETKQLRELKEEISANLLEKINDLISNGHSEQEAFTEAISSLGDMGELVDSLKSASADKVSGATVEKPRSRERALVYTIAVGLLLVGVFASAIVYFSDYDFSLVLAVLMLFGIPAVVAFTYLVLTEKRRRKMGPNWQKKWIKYYSNPNYAAFKENLSGALWIFAFGLFMVLGFTVGWKYSWLVYVFATGIQTLISEDLEDGLSGALWIFAAGFFMIVGYTISWKYSWLVFIFTAGIQALVAAFFSKETVSK